MESKYSEHEKMKAVKAESLIISDFLDWLYYEKNYEICIYSDHELYPIHQSFEKILADYFSIDLQKISEEKDLMVKKLREMNK